MIRILTYILLAFCAVGCEPPKKASPAKGKVSAKAKMGKFSAKVVAVHDGDTCTVYDGKNPQTKVRLAEIDGPELKTAPGPTGRESPSDSPPPLRLEGVPINSQSPGAFANPKTTIT